MSFADFQDQRDALQLLQRSLSRGRLGHAYLFSGGDLDQLELMARTLAKTLNCEGQPSTSAVRTDCCDQCSSCRKIDHATHPDVLWVRPESKSRLTSVKSVRDLMGTLNLKPTQAPYKVAVLVAAERMTTEAANSFLKTLEEPPSNCVLILLSTDPQLLLETILSRCLRLNFGVGAGRFEGERFPGWLPDFTQTAVRDQGSLLSRYRLLSVLLKQLGDLKTAITESLTARSPLRQYDDVDPDLEERWEKELAAAIEAEYRRQRADCLAAFQWWLRDVWLQTLPHRPELLTFPQLAAATLSVSARVPTSHAMENLRVLEQVQRFLASTNVQESLTLEVGLLKLKL